MDIGNPAGGVIEMAKNDSKPAAQFRVGFVSASVWKNDNFFNVEVTRSYKDGDEYKYTNSLGQGDLLNAVKALERAEQFISEQQ
jgi:hypothetical protein